ncbi:methyltransferase [Thetidibacter halocola]|uniref:Methyltransferase n=1 Tax=Thetidibacter halocola TaxID=2827239 RepID=A0A8J7WI24_9RHOB|nr:methyltransferase [Thetidibacter halocola]MBS0126824.1 methyltransferase [Thetidibacter halocola]
MTPPDTLPFGAEDAFLTDLSGVAALREAVALGLIDALEDRRDAAALAQRLGVPERGLRLLLLMLEDAGVIAGGGLTEGFAAVWDTRRFVLCAKLEFLHRAALDVGEDLHGLLFDLRGFQARARTFGFFRYDRALDVSDAALAASRPWVDYVTALSLTETPHLLPAIDLGGARRLLEIGGNTGVLSEALLERDPGLTAAVLDLPAVCALGRQRMAGRPAEARLRFVAGDARQEPWPGPADAILFKSVLHDWPEAEMRQFLSRAAARLAPGGRLVICERIPMEDAAPPFPLWMLANLVFAPFYRAPQVYADILSGLGLVPEPPKRVDLDLPFAVLAARKPVEGSSGSF